jgi:hypothetical protein
MIAAEMANLEKGGKAGVRKSNASNEALISHRSQITTSEAWQAYDRRRRLKENASNDVFISQPDAAKTDCIPCFCVRETPTLLLWSL